MKNKIFLILLFSFNIYSEKLIIYAGSPIRSLKNSKLFEFIELIKDSGFNAVHLNYGFEKINFETYKKASDIGLKIFIHIGSPKKIGERNAVDSQGRNLNIECPLNEKIWKSLILDRITEFFNKYKGEKFLDSVIGIHFDIESYVDPDICYCDYCFYKYMEMKKLKSNVRKEERKEYLFEKGLLLDYKNFLKNNLENIFKEIKKKINSFNDALLISYYPFSYKGIVFPFKIFFTFLLPSKFPPPLWWYVYRKSEWISHALLKGMADEKNSVILWDDYYYWSGYIPGYDKLVNKKLKKVLNYKVRWMGSIDYLSDCFGKADYTPERAGREFYELLKNNEYGAILYGEIKKDTDIYESHLPYLQKIKQYLILQK
ncbi:MAG: hypothetical protein NC922_05625 [Candidatus Omnitrophica bacterium]|nr:hypothetical protein [Candidatus Omnitrophota bacterium]